MLVRDGYVCPICEYDAYCRVVVFRESGARYVTPFYKCGGCQVMFHNPLTFSASANAARIRPRRTT